MLSRRRRGLVPGEGRLPGPSQPRVRRPGLGRGTLLLRLAPERRHQPRRTHRGARLPCTRSGGSQAKSGRRAGPSPRASPNPKWSHGFPRAGRFRGRILRATKPASTARSSTGERRAASSGRNRTTWRAWRRSDRLREGVAREPAADDGIRKGGVDDIRYEAIPDVAAEELWRAPPERPQNLDFEG